MAERLNLKDAIVQAFEEIQALTDDREWNEMERREQGINPEVVASFAAMYAKNDNFEVDANDLCIMFEVGWRARKLWERK